MKMQRNILSVFLLGLTMLATLTDALPQSARAAPKAEMTLQYVGYLGGASRAVFVQGNYAYATLAVELAVLNVANPAQPTRVGSLVLPEEVGQVQVASNYAYLLGPRNTAVHLWVVNVSNPATPTLVAKYDLAPGIAHGEQTNAFYISGSYGYVVSEGSTFSGLRIINLSNPSAPTPAGTLNTNPFRPGRIFVAGQYAYLTGDEGLSNTNRLRVVDVSQPDAPQVVGSLNLAGGIMGLHVSGNYACLADYTLGRLRVVDISNPAQPLEVGSVAVFWGTPNDGAWDVFVSGNYAYVSGVARSGSSKWGGVEIVDVSDPAHRLSIVGGYATSELAEFPGDIFISGSHAFLAGDESGLWTINVSDPAHPTLAARYQVLSAMGVVVSGAPSTLLRTGPSASPSTRFASGQAYVYVADSWGMKVVDITNGAFPTVVGVYKPPPPLTAGGAIDVSGTYVYLTNQRGWLRVIDVSQPTNPNVVGQYNPPGVPRDVDVLGNYAYLVDDTIGGDNLRVVDISNPANPTQVGSFSAPETASMVVVSGNYAYLAGSGLRVLDVSNPANPIQVGSTLTTLSTYDVAVSGSYAYLAVFDQGLRVVDVSNPANPTQVGSLQCPGIYKVAVSGSYAFAIAQDKLHVLDVSNPTAPANLSTYTMPTFLSDVHANGEYVYATGGGGLFIFRLVPLALHAAPTALTFMAQVGGANPAPRAINVTSNGRALNWSASVDPAVGWLNVAPLSGTTSSNITVTPNIAGLAIGQYQTQLVIQASDPVQGSPQTIPVTLLVVQTLNNLYLPLVAR